MKRYFIGTMFLVAILAFVAFPAAAGKKGEAPSETQEAEQTEEAALPEGMYGPMPENIKTIGDSDDFGTKGSTIVVAKSPSGYKSVLPKDIYLTEAEKEEVRKGNYTAAIAWHYTADDWYRAQKKAIEDIFGDLNIKIVAQTDAGFDPAKQVTDIENILALNPDILISLPVELTSTAVAYQKAADAGVKIVFMDNAPPQMEGGKDYVAMVSVDIYGIGMIAADVMAEQLDYTGTAGVVYHDAAFYITDMFNAGFVDRINAKYTDIKIVEMGGFTDPYKAGEVADAILIKHPDIDGMFVTWDQPCEDVVSSAKTSGREDLVITTINLADSVVKSLATGGLVKGVGAQRPYDQGVAEATLAAYAMIGKKAPEWVAMPAYRVDKSNLAEGYETVYHSPPPDWVLNP